jgi:hypothetical protein
MKKIILLVFLVLVTSVFSNVFGQRETPAGAGDKNLGDDGIKLRSVELERIKRDANKNDPASFAPINAEIKAKFPQIKEDFESVQILEAAIIKAYTTGQTIDYSLIQTSAEGINKKAKRLDSNLFASKLEKQDDKSKEKTEKQKSIKELIVALDNSISSFVSSKIFGNVNVIEPAVAVKTRTDLVNILDLSEKLSKEAKKMK